MPRKKSEDKSLRHKGINDVRSKTRVLKEIKIAKDLSRSKNEIKSGKGKLLDSLRGLR